MCSHFPRVIAIAISLSYVLSSSAETLPQRVLKVCSDPNNMPFSNQNAEGFENQIAELLAADLGARVEYTWFAQRRGFLRNTLRAGHCDVVMGLPANFDPVETTRPYYRSTYVFVTRADSKLRITSIDDPALKRLNIGVHVVGDDYANTPPVHALGRRHIVRNVSGFTIYGDYSQPNPPARLVEAVAEGKVDVAIVWGPFGGYFGKRQSRPLKIAFIEPESDGPDLPFVFDIAIGVRKHDIVLRDELDKILVHRRRRINEILTAFGVPMKPLPSRAPTAKR